MVTIRDYLTLDERERAAYMAGNYDLAHALQEIDTLEREISRCRDRADSSNDESCSLSAR